MAQHSLKKIRDTVERWRREAHEGKGATVMLRTIDGQEAYPLTSVEYDAGERPQHERLTLYSEHYQCEFYADEGDHASRITERQIRFMAEGEPGEVFR